MMRIALALLLFLATPLFAADVEVGIRHLGMFPMASSDVDVVSSRGFGATAEVFWTERLSTQFAGTFLNPAAFLDRHDLDLGTLGIDAYSASARWHFRPASRFSPFAGGGVALVTFGNLEDRFNDDLEIELEHTTAFLVEGGLRYRFRPRIILDAAVSYMPLETEPSFVRNDAGYTLPEKLALDPLTISVGASWRF